MKITKYIVFLFPIIILSSSCNSNSFYDCECSELNIYGTPSDILTPIRISRADIMEYEPQVVSNKESIEELISEIHKLKSTEAMDGIDNRFVIQAKCKRRRNIIVGSNNYITRIGNSYFKPSPEFLDLVSTHTTIKNKLKNTIQ